MICRSGGIQRQTKQVNSPLEIAGNFFFQWIGETHLKNQLDFPIDFFLLWGVSTNQKKVMITIFQKIKNTKEKAFQAEVEIFIRSMKEFNRIQSFHGFSLASEREILEMRWNDRRTRAEALARSFVVNSDVWSYLEAEAWKKEYKKMVEDLELINRLCWYFLDASPFDIFD